MANSNQNEASGSKYCYLCGSDQFDRLADHVRDSQSIGVIKCAGCGLVTLDSLKHITKVFYEQSGMHGPEMPSMVDWLQECRRDDLRRFNDLQCLVAGKNLLDFGCGAGGFLSKAKSSAKYACGVELETRAREHWAGKIPIFASLQDIEGKFDLVTSFHVFEHLSDPIAQLKDLAEMLVPGGRLVVEVPSANDALLNLYDSEKFKHFSYWSQHLFLFTADTLRRLGNAAGVKTVAIEQYQRYPLSNHLHWLATGQPGGHQKWHFLDTPEVERAYASRLAAIGQCDTLIAHFEAR